jgi:predicted nuclease of predicted toxin-antitoxin system
VRFVVDASLPRSATARLRELGHEAIDVRDIGLASAIDEVTAEHAQRNQ